LEWGFIGYFLRKKPKRVMAVAVRAVGKLKDILVN
jgi:hypothetical protein